MQSDIKQRPEEIDCPNSIPSHPREDVFLTVTDVERSIAFYEKALAPLGIKSRRRL